MARIRSIKPEFPQSESMGNVSRDARLLFILLWPICDDHGRTRAASRMLASTLFPYDEDAKGLIDVWLDELEHEGCIKRYSVNGSAYLEVCKWLDHQKIDKPSKPQFPEPLEDSANPREHSENTHPRKGREGKGEEGKGSESNPPAEDAPPKIKKPRKAKPEGTPLPDEFCISERVRKWATEKGHVNLDTHFDNFVSKARAKGYTYVDWDEALMGAIRENWAKVPLANGKPNNFLERVGYG